MINTDVLVSVIMSTYNNEKTLANAINSILKQSFVNFEFIIVNDGSTDKTKEILENYKIIDSRIKIIEHPNMGLTKSLNIAVNSAKGKFIARQDADDISYSLRLEKQVKYLTDNNDVKLLGTNQLICRGEVKTNGPYFAKHKINQVVFYRSPFAHTSAMFDLDCFKEIGLYNENYRTAQDFEAWMRFANKYQIAMLEDVLVERYVHANSVSSKNSRNQCFNAFKARLKHCRNPFLVLHHSFYQYITPLLPPIFSILKKRVVNDVYILNGDYALSKKEKINYLISNFVIYILSFFNSKSYIKRYRRFLSPKSHSGASPMRDYIDSYLDIYFSKIDKSNPLKVLDIGCGEGLVYNLMAKHGISGEYKGIDIYENKNFHSIKHNEIKKDLIISSIEDIEKDKPEYQNFDLIISITSLEHIAKDRLVVNNSDNMKGQNGVELHIVPAGFSLMLYWLHGWRQYNRAMIYELFKNKKDWQVVQAGGLASGLLHFILISIPNKVFKFSISKRFECFYNLSKKVALKLDSVLPVFPVVYYIEVRK